MTFISSLNLNFSFCTGIKEILVPSFSHFNFDIPDVFTFFKFPLNPSLPNLSFMCCSWNLKPVTHTSAVTYQPPVLTRLPDNNYYRTPSQPLLPVPELSKPKISNTVRKYAASGDKKVDNSYSSLSKSQAAKKAQSDTNLEHLSGGRNWSIAKNSFKTDIPYAKKGTGKILDKVSSMIGEKLVITSALGTGQAGNPHVRHGYASHHNAENPKLDIRTNGHGRELAAKLRATGYFSRVSLESDHLDVQIDSSKFEQFNVMA